MQMSWAGELEGWLTSPPQWRVVGEPNNEWQPALREATEQPVEVVAPMPQQELAALTARRAAQGVTNRRIYFRPNFRIALSAAIRVIG